MLKKRFSELPVDHPNYLGAMVFNWGWRQEQTQTWFNVFSAKGEKNALYYYLSEKYGKPIEQEIPKVDTLLLDGKANANEFLFESDEQHRAEVKLAKMDSKFKVEWSIRTEDWYFIKADTPPALEGLVKDPNLSSIKFNCPPKPGPYRLFVKVSDSLGNFASANLPFYVVQ